MSDESVPVGHQLSPRLRGVMRRVNRRTGSWTSAPAVGLHINVAGSSTIVYFPDTSAKLYQLAMWLPILEQSPPHLRPIIVTRNEPAFRLIEQMTNLTTVLLPRLEDVLQFYARVQAQAVLYVNNSKHNFQSLIYQSAVHIHVNHGESDKISMVSNQAKAYDRVFVAGQAAVDRYNRAVAWLDNNNLIRVGRPQLDIVKPHETSWAGPTLMYAPTWEGENDANNYSSLNVMGVAVVEQFLQVPNARVWYKPHPRILKTPIRSMTQAHDKILKLLRNPTHQVFLDDDVLPLLAATDYLVADVSSVTLDFLYLRADHPLALADRRDNLAELLKAAPIASGAHVVTAKNVSGLAADVKQALAADERAAERAALVKYYFDGLHPGESSQRFFAALNDTITDHKEAVMQLQHAPSGRSVDSVG